MPAPRKPVRGVFERPLGSNIWWILYYVNGQRRREKVGRRSDAIDLYRIRKAAARTGAKIPDLRKRTTLAQLIDGALLFAKANNRSYRDYESKAELIRPCLGFLIAEEIQPEVLVEWIVDRDVSNGTFNRYRSFFSLCYREGINNGKVTNNVARRMRLRRESSGRKRFLSRDEYDSLHTYLTKRWPAKLDAFMVSIYTGMRLMEQFTITWSQVDFKRNVIQLSLTKSGDDGEIPMNSIVRGILERRRTTSEPSPKDLVFKRKYSGEGALQMRWFTAACTACDIEDYTWHNNRHTFCSWHAMAGTPLKTIQELARHKTISMTARYAHLCPDHKRTETERIVTPPAPKVVEMKRRRS